MSKLILVYGLTEDTSEEQLLKHLNGLTINAVKATRIWLDPFVKQSPRAVALFEKEIDECELFRCAQTKGSNFKGKPLLFETVTSPQSVVVNINGAIGYGSRDKLRFLFSSKRYNGQKVCEVKQMNQEWFEITFEEKWKAVSIISLNTWEANNVMLKVCPYFTCFQEQCQNQLTRLMSKSKKYSIPEKTYVRKKSTYFFRSRLFTFLMGVLDLKSSIQTHYMELNITIDTDEMEAEIEGPEYETKLVHQTISCEEKKFSFTDLEVQFLTDPEIQETLQNLIKDKKWKIVLNKTTPGFVVDQTGKQVTLMDFLSSLVIVKECSSIPSKDFQDTSDWVSFLQNFYKRYPYCRVMIHNGVVELVSLSYQDQDLDFMVTNKGISQIVDSLQVDINEEESEIIFQGPKDELKHVKSLVISESNKIFFTDLEIEFLTIPEIQECFKKLVEEKKWQLEFDKSQPGFVVTAKSGCKQVTLMDFLSSLVIVKDCSSIPSKDFQDTSDWMSFLQNFYKRYPYCRVMIHNGVVELVSLSYQDQDLDLMVTNVNAKLGKLMSMSLTQTIEVKSQVKRENFEKSTICFQNRIFPWLSNILNIKKGISQIVDSLQVDINEEESEIIFQGSKDELKHVKSLVISESSKITTTGLELQFMMIPEIQEYFKKLVEDNKWQLEFDSTQASFFVTDKSGDKQVTLMDFLSSLVIVKDCSSIPSDDFQDSSEWITFLGMIHEKYPFRRVMIHSDIVKLVSLSYQDYDLDVMVEMINDKLDKIMRMSITQTIEEKKQENREIIERSTMFFQNKIFLWLLNILNFKHAVSEVVTNLQMDINEEEYEIMIAGTREDIKCIKSIALSDKNKIFFSKSEEQFLDNEGVMKKIESEAQNENWHIVLDKDTIMVKTDHLDQMSLPMFASTRLIKRNEIPFPTEDYHESLQWLSFRDNFNATETTFHITGSSDSFTILSLATENPQSLDVKLGGIYSHLDSFLNSAAKNTGVPLKGSADKIEQKSIACNHQFFFWILSVLGLNAAVRKYDSSLSLEIDLPNSELHVKGVVNGVQKLVSLILALEERIAFTEDEDIFLAKEETKQFILSLISSSGIYIDLLKNEDKITLKDRNEALIDFENFVSTLITQKKCRPLPTDFLENQNWKKFCESLSSATPPGYIILKGRNVLLYTFDTERHSASQMVLKVNEFIESIGKMKSMNLDTTQYESNVKTKNDCTDNLVKKTTSISSLRAKFVSTNNTSIKVNSPEKNMETSENVVKLSTKTLPFEKLYAVKDKSEFYTVTVHHSTFHDSSMQSTERKSYKIIRDDKGSSQILNRSTSSDKNQPVYDVFPLIPQEYEYCERFLQEKFVELESKYAADVKLSFQAIDIKCASQTDYAKIFEELKNILSEIYFEDRLLEEYPGLSLFAQSEDGKQLMHTIASTYKCLLEFPDFNLQDSNNSIQNLEYKVIVLSTAICEGYKLHYVLGHEMNVQVDMKVEFRINDTVQDCKVEPQKSSNNIIIKLPSVNEKKQNVKESFTKVLRLVIDQLTYVKCKSVAFSTGYMHDINFIYIEYLFDILPQELTEAFQTSNHSCNVYIVEPSSQDVFNAFLYALKDHKITLDKPDSSSWDEISFTDASNCLDYRLLKIKVSTKSDNSKTHSGRTLVCYPIGPNLDVSVIHDSFCSQTLLEQEVHKFKHVYPEGLQMGDCLHMKSLEDDIEILLYCCPEWGYDSVMAISDSLQSVLLNSAEFEYVHIIPPGLHVNPKYPKSFLAWEAFELQLRKRYSKSEKSLNKVIQNKKASEDNESDFSLCSVKNKIPSLLVSFWGTSAESIKEAESSFINHLDNLMKESLKTYTFDTMSTVDIEKIVNSAQDVPVSLLLEKTFREMKPKKGNKQYNKGTGEKELVSSSLHIQGLSHEFVEDYTKEIQEIISSNKPDLKS
ncbi:hypothetical protein Bpfe_027010 [Biomphalaria pfeifferi]|uniref:EF-hand domain-containing protein n=1 Tax=Biomphalaria pfeifferi TaxID=112525 RepID=A0AAD8AW59_BIOPF|nr:hypothetical protein Bpfe_027010 [Biomphalaria pfeifferi]